MVVLSVKRYGHWFTIAPALTTSEAECTEILRRLERTLSSFEEELH
jgi:acetylornithine/succinyldiaminopimelate/putrescine aminotransferase